MTHVAKELGVSDVMVGKLCGEKMVLKQVLPVPATFVIDQKGMIRYAHVEADYRERSEPVQVLELVKSMA
jgi:peroxiredoxin